MQLQQRRTERRQWQVSVQSLALAICCPERPEQVLSLWVEWAEPVSCLSEESEVARRWLSPQYRVCGVQQHLIWVMANAVARDHLQLLQPMGAVILMC